MNPTEPEQPDVLSPDRPKVAVITGAGRGIGRAISLALARQGIVVHLVARTASQLAETAQLVEADGGVAFATAVDVSRPDDVLDLLKLRVEGLSGPPQILVNAAGIYGPIARIEESDPRAWLETIAVNTVAPYLLCRAFVGGMRQQGWGRIVNVSSAASLHPPGPLTSAYATSKVALNQLTRGLAAELTGTGVTANVIHPGEVKTAMWRDIADRADQLGSRADSLRQWAREVERTGGDPPEKAADLVLWLIGDESATINGQFLWIANGMQQPIPVSWSDG